MNLAMTHIAAESGGDAICGDSRSYDIVATLDRITFPDCVFCSNLMRAWLDSEVENLGDIPERT